MSLGAMPSFDSWTIIEDISPWLWASQDGVLLEAGRREWDLPRV
jgi:hypothetical protein